MDIYKNKVNWENVNWTNPLILDVIGSPASGKGTLVIGIRENLKKQGYEPPVIATGDLCREEIEKGSKIGKKIADIVDRGDIVDDNTIIDLFEYRLKELYNINGLKDGFIIDGFPRTYDQATRLTTVLKSLKTQLDMLVLHLEVPWNILRNRVKNRRVCKECGTIYHLLNYPPKKKGICDLCEGEVYQRLEDKNIIRRLRVYQENYGLIKDYYMSPVSIEKIAIIDATEDPRETYQKACTYIDLFQKKIPF